MYLTANLALSLLASSAPCGPQLQGVSMHPSGMPGVGPGLERWRSGDDCAPTHHCEPFAAAQAGRGLTAAGVQSIIAGPDGLIYVAAEATNTLLRFGETMPTDVHAPKDSPTHVGATGAHIKTLTPPAHNGPNAATSLAFIQPRR